MTGGARRIGLRIAERLAGAGYAVVLHCGPASIGEGERAAAAIASAGGRAAALSLDLAEAAAAGTLIAKAAGLFGPLTLLVNNASVFEEDSALEFDGEGFDRHFAVNLRAPAILARDFVRQAPAGASIVNIIDQRVLRPTPKFFSYTLSKAALWTATQTMAQAFAARGVRVNAVGPGPVLRQRQRGRGGLFA